MVVALQCSLNLLAPQVVRRLSRARLRQRDNHLVRRSAARIAHPLNQRAMDPSLVHRRTEMVLVRLRRKRHPQLRPALEVHAQRNMVPKQNAHQPRDREDQRKTKEIPLLAQPVDVCALEQFHALTSSK